MSQQLILEGHFTEKLRRLWAERLEPHYETAAMDFPVNAHERVWYVKSCIDGKKKQIQADSNDEVLEQVFAAKPFTIKYSATSKKHPDHYFEVPLYFPTTSDAENAARILNDELAVPVDDMVLSSAFEGGLWLIVRGNTFANQDRNHADALVEHLTGSGFQAPSDVPTSSTQRRFAANVANLLTQYRRLNPAQLQQALTSSTTLAAYARDIVDAIRENDLEAVPAFKAQVHAYALRQTFPSPTQAKTLKDPRIPLGGSINGANGKTIKTSILQEAQA